jgi:hypothetical protein
MIALNHGAQMIIEEEEPIQSASSNQNLPLEDEEYEYSY